MKNLRSRVLCYTLVMSAAILIGCSKEELTVKQTIEKRQLSVEELVLKNNLNEAAQILSKVIAEDAVKQELRQITTFTSEKPINSVGFKDLLTTEPIKKGSHTLNFPQLSRRLTEEMSNLKNRDFDLYEYLAENNCELYCPYPLDFYDGKDTYTIAGHPIDNDEEANGYKTSDGVTSTYLVNEEYAENEPVLIIQNKSSQTNEVEIYNGENVENRGGNRTPIYQISMNWFKCPNYCGGIFEGDLEIIIERYAARPKSYGSGVGECYAATKISFIYEKAYVKCAKKNWSKWNNGWKSIYQIWDPNWSEDKIRQGIMIYEHDSEAVIRTIKVSASYAGFSGSVEVSLDAQYEGDFLGSNCEWWRSWFFETHYNPAPSEPKYKGLILRTTGDPKFTMPITVY